MKFIAEKNSVSARKVQLLAEYAGENLSVQAPPKGGACCAKELCSACLETPQGAVCSTNSAVRYIARSRPDRCLYGETFFDAAQVDSWIDWTCCALECAFGDAKKMAEAVSVLNGHLKTRTYLAAERISAADLVCIATLSLAPAEALTAELISKNVNFKRWFDTMASQKPVKKVLGDLSAPKKSAAPQKENKPAAKAAEEDVEAPPKPQKCPLDDLPPSAFILDAWKRHYSNTKDLYGDAMKYFWENYDPQGYSIWYMKYEKLEGECTVPFVTSNQLGGFLQRTDPSLRKYAFGNFNVIGGDGSYDIVGVWLFRGTEVAPQMKDHPSFEYHKWRKLDHTNEADKQLVADYWCSEDKCEGKEIADSKIYK